MGATAGRACSRRLALLGLAFLSFLVLSSAATIQAGPLSASVHVDPTNPNPCATCHSLQRDGASAQMRPDANQKCFSCHSDAIGPVFSRAVYELSAHAPAWSAGSRTATVWPGRKAVDKGLCINCHDPHGTPSKAMLRAGTAFDSNKLCFTCHTDFAAYGAFPGKTAYAEGSPHGNAASGVQWPRSDYASGECVNCHDPHGSTNGKMLRVTNNNELCFTCHESSGAFDSLWPGKVGYNDGRGVHVSPPLVPKLGVKLTYPDRKYLPGQCLNCHNPHGGIDNRMGSLGQKLTNLPGERLCYQCHTDKRQEFAKLSRHGIGNPASNMKCTSCHNPHLVRTGSRMVTDPTGGFSSDPTMEYPALPPAIPTQTGNDFCLKCHDGSFAGRAADVKGELSMPGLINTGFRSAEGSLHEAHVNTYRLGCANCHDAHASEKAKLLYKWIKITDARYTTYDNVQAKASCSGSLGSCH